MSSFRLKQIGLALCLMLSLLTASPAACNCAHHEEILTSENECLSHQDASDDVETSDQGVAVDDSCVCSADQPSPSVVSKSDSKELKPPNGVVNTAQITADLRFVAGRTLYSFAPEFSNDLSYSNALKSLLPSRAPPRL